jgi:sugar phosphate isomerase/epimerase
VARSLCGASCNSIVRVSKDNSSSRARRSFLSIGKKPSKQNLPVASPDSVSAVMPAQVRAAIMEEARTLADIAAQYSLTLAFEFHGKTLNDTGESSLHFLLDCAKENIKTYWQPLSFSDNEKNLSMVLPHLCAVHVFTWDDDYNRYPLADGETQWKRYLSILKEAKIPTKLIMEFVKYDNEEQFLEDAAFLRSLIED